MHRIHDINTAAPCLGDIVPSWERLPTKHKQQGTSKGCTYLGLRAASLTISLSKRFVVAARSGRSKEGAAHGALAQIRIDQRRTGGDRKEDVENSPRA